jgi:hypothetical protein
VPLGGGSAFICMFSVSGFSFFVRRCANRWIALMMTDLTDSTGALLGRAASRAMTRNWATSCESVATGHLGNGARDRRPKGSTAQLRLSTHAIGLRRILKHPFSLQLALGPAAPVFEAIARGLCWSVRVAVHVAAGMREMIGECIDMLWRLAQEATARRARFQGHREGAAEIRGGARRNLRSFN